MPEREYKQEMGISVHYSQSSENQQSIGIAAVRCQNTLSVAFCFSLTIMVAASLHVLSNFRTFRHINTTTPSSSQPKKFGANFIRCERSGENRQVTVKNGNDSLEICRVLNGMWQTSGGWGRIDRDEAVDAMLRYADAGLFTFDMADHCKNFSLLYFLLFVLFSLVFSHHLSHSSNKQIKFDQTALHLTSLFLQFLYNRPPKKIVTFFA